MKPAISGGAVAMMAKATTASCPNEAKAAPRTSPTLAPGVRSNGKCHQCGSGCHIDRPFGDGGKRLEACGFSRAAVQEADHHDVDAHQHRDNAENGGDVTGFGPSPLLQQNPRTPPQVPVEGPRHHQRRKASHDEAEDRSPRTPGHGNHHDAEDEP